MNKQTAGIHHITAIVGHPQENVDFYAGVLGLRLIKQTVNFDDPTTYHLYFGNEQGSPGTIITFFPWPNAYKGRIGDGQVGVTSYAVPVGALPFWEARFNSYNIAFTKTERFGETVLQLDDLHGLHIELVERAEGDNNTWAFNGVTADTAIKGFAGATLYSSAPAETVKTVMDVMGLTEGEVAGNEQRFVLPNGQTVDVKMTTGEAGTMGVGTVHHIAWRAADDTDHAQWREHVQSFGEHVTPIKDRNYFNALYFREKGHILFEIATDGPGFAHDESLETMGEALMLPPQYEAKRAELMEKLAAFTVRTV